MNTLGFIRNTLQIFSLAVFMYQAVTFLQRYHESPTVITTSQKIWDESYRPRIMVCDHRFFNVSRSRELGYEWYTSLLSGEVNGFDNSISWQGKYNSTWSELESDILNITNINTKHIEFYKQNKEKIIMLKHFQPFTVCYEIVDFSQILYIGLKRDASIYLIDPQRFTNHRLNTLSMKGDNIAIPEIIKSSQSTSLLASVTTTALEKRTDSGNCKNYPSASGYSECIENAYIKLFKKVLGCVPPWFRQERNVSSIVCTKQIDFKDRKTAAKAKALLDSIATDTSFMIDSKNESEWCMPPCKQLIYNVQIVRNAKATYVQNWAQFKFTDVMSIEHETNGYDTFRLIIEIGSSLGLWLGLCIIGIFDIIIEGVLRLQGIAERM